MTAKKQRDPREWAEFLSDYRKQQAQKSRGYRARALKMFPHVCGSCGREFSGKRLRELTVHHKDHNHENNPSDGSNWELLCIYCHDHEHEKYHMKDRFSSADLPSSSPGVFQPFADLDALLDDAGEDPPESSSG